MKTRMLKCSCSCDAAYVCRTTRLYLERYGPPICPACFQPMRAPEGIAVRVVAAEDVFAGFGAIDALDNGPALQPIENRYVTIRAERACMRCGRTHDRGFAMQYCVGRDGRSIVRGWFCASGCDAPAESEIPGGAPRSFPLVRGDATGDIGFSAVAGYGEGFGSGSRS